jgi:ribosomal protein L21E
MNLIKYSKEGNIKEVKNGDLVKLVKIKINRNNYHGHYEGDIGRVLNSYFNENLIEVVVDNRISSSKYGLNNSVIWHGSQVEWIKYDIVEKRKDKLNKLR